MELSTGRLEPSSRIQERPFDRPADEKGRGGHARHKNGRNDKEQPLPEMHELPEEREHHQLDNLA